MGRATLAGFARANDGAAGTTKKLQKQAVLSAYFKELREDDLKLAVRFAGGRAFPTTTETVLNVGGATVWDVALGLLGVGHEELRETVIRSGEIGEALAKLWERRDPPAAAAGAGGEITLGEMEEAFKELAATGNGERKREILWALFSRCADGREAAYLAKVIFRDMRTGVQEGVLQAAVAEAFGKAVKEIQQTQLLVGDLEEVAVLAKGDRLGEARFTLFHPIQFMLATPQETFAEAAGTLDGRGFFAEDKLDGIRAQVHKAGGKVYIYTRTMDRTDESFPDVVGQVMRLPGEFLLDGEIVPYEHGEVLPFAHIQRRLGRKVLTKKVLAENPCRFVAFDVLYREGRLLMDRPLRERRAELDALRATCPEVRDGEARGGDVEDPAMIATKVEVVTTEGEIASAFEAARGRRNEGIILKDPGSAYSPGRRGKWWLKLKTHLPTLDCVVTAAEYGHGKRRGVLSDYTFAVWDREPGEEGAALVNIGKAFTGLTDAEIAEYTKVFLELSRGNNGRVHVVEPRVVIEIACDQIQKSARHAGGFALRFPRIKRVRVDKRPEDADRLARVVEVYESQGNFAKGKREKRVVAEEPGLFDGM
jgi:DNA ligase-1